MDLAGQMDYYGNSSYTDGCWVKTCPAKDCEDAQEPGYTVDTTDGDISLAVNGSVNLESGSNLNAEGPGQVDIYVNGTTAGDDLTVRDSDVFAPSNNATQLTVLGKENFTGKVVDDARYTGVIHVPAGEDGNGEVVIDRKKRCSVLSSPVI